MATVLKIGPHDHGRLVNYEEFLSGDYKEGYQYEIIEGRLYVSPQANLPHDRMNGYVYGKLETYVARRPKVINYVSCKARVFVPGVHLATVPEPDVAAYHDFPADLAADWQDVSPLLTVEVLSGDDEFKDLVRNVDLYWRVPSIQEYWLFDIRQNAARPTLRVFRRGSGDEWEITDFGPDDTYTTALLPGFKLPVRPSNDKPRASRRK